MAWDTRILQHTGSVYGRNYSKRSSLGMSRMYGCREHDSYVGMGIRCILRAVAFVERAQYMETGPSTWPRTIRPRPSHRYIYAHLYPHLYIMSIWSYHDPVPCGFSGASAHWPRSESRASTKYATQRHQSETSLQKVDSLKSPHYATAIPHHHHLTTKRHPSHIKTKTDIDINIRPNLSRPPLTSSPRRLSLPRHVQEIKRQCRQRLHEGCNCR